MFGKMLNEPKLAKFIDFGATFFIFKHTIRFVGRKGE
jgi:hypothetical protein